MLNRISETPIRAHVGRMLVVLALLISPYAWAAQYTINAGDTLAISVWQEPELQGDVVVRPDGYFSFPLAGDVLAAGRSVTEVEALVKERLREYIPDVVLTVSARALTGYKIYVIGQVRNPGEFMINTDIDVMRALALAGGTNEFANLGDIRVLRRAEGTQRTLSFNYREVARGINLDQNIMLKARDMVVVP